MSWLSRSRRFVWALVAAQVVLLAVLATLQYRWTEGVSRALAERMRSALESAAGRFAEDFDRELTRVFLHFQPQGPGVAEDLGEVYARLLQDWRQTAPHPALVAEIDLADLRPARRAADGGPGFQRLAPEEGRFVEAGWPPELAALRERLEDGPGRREDGPPFMAPEVPALMAPLIGRPAADRRTAEDLRPRVAGWIVLRLDPDHLRDELLPLLTERHFAGGEDLDFELAVVTAPSRQPIYRSDPQLPETSAAYDLEIGIFGFLRDEELRRLFFDTRLAESVGGPGRRGWRRGLGHPAGRGPAGRGPAGRDPGGPRFGPRPWPPGAGPGEGSAGGGERRAWRLLVRHREGSLDAAVDRFRRRNLGIGFGVLALLALTVSMLIAGSRRAQRLAAQQVEFVAGITHELRTPIAALRSLGQNLADGVAAEPRQVRRYGALIERQSSRLSRLVEQVLELSGILSGRKSLALEPTAVAGVVEAAVADCRSLAEESGARIEVEIGDDLPPIAADAEALARAVANLIANAVKHGGDGESPWVGVRGSALPGEVAIEVADRGPGIPREELSRVFEPFYRGCHATADQTPGAGLGLSLVRRIAEAHGGRVEVRSEAAGGSVFTLRLPALRGDDGEREDPDR